MNRLQFYHHYLYKKVLYLEWAFLLLCGLTEFLVLRLNPQSLTGAPNLALSLILLIIVAILSCFAPLQNPYWDRICYLFLELVLLTGCAALGLARFVFPLFMVVIAKACLMLDKRGIFITFGAALLAQIAYGSYKIILSQPHLRDTLSSPGTIVTLVIGSLLWTYAAITLMILVALLTRSLVAEQRSRLQTEQLSRELELLATELERTRIAREIHDSLGHTLTSLNVQLDVARRLSERDPGKAREALEVAKELATQSLTDVRSAVHTIRNADFNLQAAIEALVQEVSSRNSLEVNAKLQIPDLPPATSYQLYRIVQECLTNVLKHAEASAVTIEIDNPDGTVQLNVSDNGRGLNPAQLNQGYGIRGMQERVENLKGKVEIHAGAERGTRIQVVIPV